MGLFLRKDVTFGPVRSNLSKSGTGVPAFIGPLKKFSYIFYFCIVFSFSFAIIYIPWIRYRKRQE